VSRSSRNTACCSKVARTAATNLGWKAQFPTAARKQRCAGNTHLDVGALRRRRANPADRSVTSSVSRSSSTSERFTRVAQRQGRVQDPHPRSGQIPARPAVRPPSPRRRQPSVIQRVPSSCAATPIQPPSSSTNSDDASSTCSTPHQHPLEPEIDPGALRSRRAQPELTPHRRPSASIAKRADSDNPLAGSTPSPIRVLGTNA